MRFLKNSLSFLVLPAFIFTQIHAYVPAHLGGEGAQTSESALQVQSAVLLNEDGTPRCRIGDLGEPFIADLDALRECDKNDELHTLAALGDEEISYGTAVPPAVKVLFISAGVGAAIGCLGSSWAVIMSIGKEEESNFSMGVFAISSVVAGAIGVLAPMAIATEMGLHSAVAIGGILASVAGFGPGAVICDKRPIDR